MPVSVPAGRYGQGPDIAAVVLFLASDLGSFLVGQSITADGGCLAVGGWVSHTHVGVNPPLLLQWFEDDPDAAAATAHRRFDDGRVHRGNLSGSYACCPGQG